MLPDGLLYLRCSRRYDACYCTGHSFAMVQPFRSEQVALISVAKRGSRKDTRRAKRFLRVCFLVRKGSQGALPLHTTLLARCSVLHPTDAERISRRSVFRWTTDLTKIFAAVGEIWERRRIWRSYSDTTEHRWEIVRRLLRAISHEMRPSVNIWYPE